MSGPRRIVAVVPDLMDRSRLSAAGDGVEVRFVAAAALASVDDVDLVVVDVTREGVLDAVAAAGLAVPVVGFGPHVDDDLLSEAARAGCDRVLPRSRFFARWPDV